MHMHMHMHMQMQMHMHMHMQMQMQKQMHIQMQLQLPNCKCKCNCNCNCKSTAASSFVPCLFISACSCSCSCYGIVCALQVLTLLRWTFTAVPENTASAFNLMRTLEAAASPVSPHSTCADSGFTGSHGNDKGKGAGGGGGSKNRRANKSKRKGRGGKGKRGKAPQRANNRHQHQHQHRPPAMKPQVDAIEYGWFHCDHQTLRAHHPVDHVLAVAEQHYMADPDATLGEHRHVTNKEMLRLLRGYSLEPLPGQQRNVWDPNVRSSFGCWVLVG